MSAQRRRSSLNKAAPSPTGERRLSASVKTYQLDKCLDPKQLDKIIYQAGIGYQSASSSTRASQNGPLSFDIDGFAVFLTQSRCLSVLLFWKEAEEYLNMFSQKERAACAQKIFQRYLKKGAEYEINLTGVNDGTVKDIESKLANPAEDLFEKTQKCAYEMMSLELFPRFWDAVKESGGSGGSDFQVNQEATLKECLSDEKQVLLFSEYCKLHFCEEQVLFWLEAQDHKLLFDPTDMLDFGQRLYDTYIDEQKAEARINISDSDAKKIKAVLDSKKVDRDLFAQASQSVETFLELDVFPRYKEAVASGEYNPSSGKGDVNQDAKIHGQEEGAGDDVDMTKPSKAAVKKALIIAKECEVLREAAAKVNSAEMIDYCKDCIEYAKLFDDADRKTKSATMIKKYLTAGCDSPVNIPDTQLKAIQKIADAPTPTIFKKSYEECVKLLSDNVYANYLTLKEEKAAAASAPAPTDIAKAAAKGGGGGGCCVIS